MKIKQKSIFHTLRPRGIQAHFKIVVFLNLPLMRDKSFVRQVRAPWAQNPDCLEKDPLSCINQTHNLQTTSLHSCREFDPVAFTSA